MSSKTTTEYALAVKKSKDIFIEKMHDYGTAWRILRTRSITDQIFIKAQRIRSIEQKGEKKVNEGIESEYIGIINYSVIALIQLELGEIVIDNKKQVFTELKGSETEKKYDIHIKYAEQLMKNKNHDYDDVWRDMRMSSLTDLILMKLLRIKQMEDNMGKTLVSEGVESNYYDIINYAIFALIKLDERSYR